MPCACNGEQPKPPEPEFKVTYPDGRTKVVTGEHEARVAVTMGAPGTTYSRN